MGAIQSMRTFSLRSASSFFHRRAFAERTTDKWITKCERVKGRKEKGEEEVGKKE